MILPAKLKNLPSKKQTNKQKNSPSGPLQRKSAKLSFKEMIPKIFHGLFDSMVSSIISLPYPYVFLMMLEHIIMY